MIKVHLSNAFSKLAALSRQGEWAVGELEDLTPTQLEVLRLLEQYTDGLGIKALAALLSVTQPTVSDAISALVRKGFITKEKDPEDKRAVLLYLNESGAGLAHRLQPSFSPVVEALSAEDQASLLGILSRAIKKLQEDGRVSTQKMCLTCSYFDAHKYASETQPHHCRLIDSPIGESDLRIHCPEHEPFNE